ncbi:hypothetical protein [Caenimonas sp. SL110]|uniref:hypothetical protein n=1 Tax=Caenimonas sp. SL110 TaxID=1450524 RepID=UPI0018729064|nr:hypothetical protein [Caenimonas sp. SL110]
MSLIASSDDEICIWHLCQQLQPDFRTNDQEARIRSASTVILFRLRISAIVDGYLSLIVDGRAKRASEGLNISQSSTINFKRVCAKRSLELRGADLSTATGVACDECTTRWASRLWRSHGGVRVSFVFGCLAQRFSFELDLVAAVHRAVQDRVSDRRVI